MTQLKVQFNSKIRKLSRWPESMDALRAQIQQKFAGHSLFEQISEGGQELAASKHKQGIDWDNVYFVYEDSEGDLNVVDEDEDLSDAKLYADQKQKTLKCSIVPRDMYETIRKEQNESLLNQS